MRAAALSEAISFFRYGAYNDAKRKNPAVSKKDFWEHHRLKFEKLPEYEHLGEKKVSAEAAFQTRGRTSEACQQAQGGR